MESWKPSWNTELAWSLTRADKSGIRTFISHLLLCNKPSPNFKQVGTLGCAQMGISGWGRAWLFLTGFTDVSEASWGWLVYSGLGWRSWVDRRGPVSMGSLLKAFSPNSPGVRRARQSNGPKHKHFSSLCLCLICSMPRSSSESVQRGYPREGCGEVWTDWGLLLQQPVF